MKLIFYIVLFIYKGIGQDDDWPRCQKDSLYYVSLYNAFERFLNYAITKKIEYASLDDFNDCAVKYLIDTEQNSYISQFKLALTRCCSRIDYPGCKIDWKMHLLSCVYSDDEKIESAVNKARLRKKQQGDSPSEILQNLRNIYYGNNSEWLQAYPRSEYFHSFYEAFERYPDSSLIKGNKLSDLDDFSECAVRYTIYTRSNFSYDEFKFGLNDCCNIIKDQDCIKKWIYNILNYWYQYEKIFLPAFNRAVSRENDEQIASSIKYKNLGFKNRLKSVIQTLTPKHKKIPKNKTKI